MSGAKWYRDGSWDAAHVRSLLGRVIDDQWGVPTRPPRRGRSEAALRAFEEKRRVRLPEDYRSFVLQIGDNVVGPGFGLIPLVERVESNRDVELPLLSEPFQLVDATDVDPDELREVHRGLLTIADFGCASWAAIVITGDMRGQMWEYGVDGYRPLLVHENGPPRHSFATWYEAWLNLLDTSPVSLGYYALSADASEVRAKLDLLLDSDPVEARDGARSLLTSTDSDVVDVALGVFCASAAAEDIPLLVELATGPDRDRRLHRGSIQADRLRLHVHGALLRIDTMRARRALMEIVLLEIGERPTPDRIDELLVLNAKNTWNGMPPRDG
jgi:hypothetical protein